MRERIFEVIEKADEKDRLSAVYDGLMIVLIILSLVPLAFKVETPFLFWIDKVTVALFVVDYLLRWMTADYKFGKKSAASFLRYPFCPMALVDLLSILPSLLVLGSAFQALRVLRLFRALRALRIFKALRYSDSFAIIGNVLKRSRSSLLAVCTLAGGYILVSALVIYNVEPDSFGNFFDAIYWATVSLTTVGYGDIYPVSTIGRMITSLSSVLGIAIVALPSGIITAGYINELQKKEQKKE